MAEGGGLAVAWAGEAWRLHGDGALERAADGTVLVADLHLGKGAAFRAGGLPVPTGSTAGDLDRLSRRLEASESSRLVILGDLLHARAGVTPEVAEVLERWRDRHAHVDLWWIPGNHDRKAGVPSSSWRKALRPDGSVWEGVTLCHEPPAGPVERPVLCGHLHPVVRLRDAQGGTLRAPCFWIRPDALVLPAFGSFTGGHRVRPRRGDRIAVVGEGSVVEVPVR